MGGIGIDEGKYLTLDDQGNVYTTGYFLKTVDFDPGVGTAEFTSAGSFDIFISKLDANGDFVWCKQMGGIGADRGNSLTIDSQGNIYTTGYFSNTVDFDPGTETANLVSSGSRDIFISKLDVDGDFVWAKGIGGVAGNDGGNSIAVDDQGNVHTIGYFEGTVDFDPGVGTAELISTGALDIFISKLDADGSYVSATRIGETVNDFGNALAVDNRGNVHTTGYFTSTVDFDPGTGTAELTSGGGNDAFITKYCQMPNVSEVTVTQPTCTVATGTVTVTTQYIDETYSFDNGATFQAENSKSGLLPDTYEVIIMNAGGCSSVATQALVDAQPTVPAAPEVTSITQPTCDVGTGIIIVTEQIVGETYSFDNGATFQAENSKSGLLPDTYEVIIMNAEGCSSAATQAIMDAQPIVPTTPEITSITQPTCDVTTGTIMVTEQIVGETYSFDNGATFQAENFKSDLISGTYEVIIMVQVGVVL